MTGGVVVWWSHHGQVPSHWGNLQVRIPHLCPLFCHSISHPSHISSPKYSKLHIPLFSSDCVTPFKLRRCHKGESSPFQKWHPAILNNARITRSGCQSEAQWAAKRKCPRLPLWNHKALYMPYPSLEWNQTLGTPMTNNKLALCWKASGEGMQVGVAEK